MTTLFVTRTTYTSDKGSPEGANQQISAFTFGPGGEAPTLPRYFTPICSTILSRSSSEPNSMTILPFFRPHETPTFVSK